MIEPTTVPRTWCGFPTRMLGTKHCDPCHELDVRIRTNTTIAAKILAHYENAHGYMATVEIVSVNEESSNTSVPYGIEIRYRGVKVESFWYTTDEIRTRKVMALNALREEFYGLITTLREGQIEHEPVDMRTIYIQDDNGRETENVLCVSVSADEIRFAQIFESKIGPDTRSEWRWFRLQNGDLILGTFPCGDTYIEISEALPI